ncbi:hypothetical protein A6046_00410 [[Haemophilus] ducreyi]|uniref:Inner membrane protein n=2 Tax=Haemophilus ducreyi TaxID=730 RepID=Q7VMI5_HAEDU|nr:hypothetical protein HD_0992 [[Haemophilus] ducreyi 35000HP]AKO30890.1 membrane protein [[Haemophilus] ducreyi]AKO32328.1 membrane protein [[Haemophilus] ducreyi]AKO33782.1 membrane protein [[Haemophilus] ducreyi]AKO35230.1 membrane protein [[Haemophilus] ducreyi]
MSAFLSATILPGNSEVVFITFATKIILATHVLLSEQLIYLLLVATVGNSLGSIVTYAIGLLVHKPINVTHRGMRWVFIQCEKYGVFALLLSGLPIVGDMLCAMAGWLRFNFWLSVLLISLGKLCRYLILLITFYPLVDYLA